MKAKIRAQKARNITGVGIVLQFVIMEGTIKPGMRTEFKNRTFAIGDRLFSYQDPQEAEKALCLVSKVRYRELSQAGSEDNIIQAKLLYATDDDLHLLMGNKEGIFIFTDNDTDAGTDLKQKDNPI